MHFVYDDGGRKESGYKGTTGDCATRAIAIAAGLPYATVYAELADGCANQRASKHTPKMSRSAANGIYRKRKWFKDYMKSLGFTWTSTMGIGTGCTVHMRSNELPKGRLVVALSKHIAAVIDGKLYDNHDCTRNGTRCVYGYWKLTEDE